MPRESSITYEQVVALADTLKAAGLKPTPRLIRERHGSGSLSTIHRHFQDWQAQQSRAIDAALVLPPPLQRAILDFMSEELARAKATLETTLAETQQTAADLAAEGERQAAAIDAMQTTIDALHADKAMLEGRLAQLDADLSATRDEAIRERQAAEAARTEHAKALLRLEAMPRLEHDVERLQSALATERAARANAEREQAASEAKADGLAARLADHQEKHEQVVAQWEGQLRQCGDIIAKLEAAQRQNENELREARQEAKESAAKLGQLESVVAALQAREPKSTKRVT